MWNMPTTPLPGGAPVGRRMRIRSRIRLPPKPPPKSIKPVQHAAATVGAAFGLVGLLGFLPGVTVHMEDLTVAGHHSGMLLFGLFETSVLHNVIHLLFAVAGLAMATKPLLARWFLVAGGTVYLVLALLGVTPAAEALAFNTPDTWLHLAVGVAMLALVVLPGRKSRPAR